MANDYFVYFEYNKNTFVIITNLGTVFICFVSV